MGELPDILKNGVIYRSVELLVMPQQTKTMALSSKLKKSSLILGIFVLGLTSGILISSYLFSKAIKPLRESIRISLATEEESKATRAERKGNIQEALTHQWNAIIYSSPEYTVTFSPSNYKDAEGLFSPFAYLVLSEIMKTSDPNGIGRDRVEGIKRGYYAYLLEKRGSMAEAESEWKIAAELMGQNDIDKMKSTTSYLIKNRDESLAIEAENAVSGKE